MKNFKSYLGIGINDIRIVEKLIKSQSIGRLAYFYTPTHMVREISLGSS